jgi:hypothetical protein
VVARPPAPAGDSRPSGNSQNAAPAKLQNAAPVKGQSTQPAKTQSGAPAKPQQKPDGAAAEKPKPTGSTESGRVTRTNNAPASGSATGSGGTVQRATPPKPDQSEASNPKPSAKPAVSGDRTGQPDRST